MTEQPPGGRRDAGGPQDAAGGPAGAGEPQEARELWAEVGQRFGELGRVVRTHLDPESPDSATWTPPPTGGWAEPGRDDRWVEARQTVRRLGRNAQLLATQAGEAVRDPVVRGSAQQAARSLGAALSRAAEVFGAQLRDNVRSPRWSDPTRPRPQPPVAPVDPEQDRRQP